MRFLLALAALSLTAVTGRAAPLLSGYFGTLKGSLTIPTLPPLSWTIEASPPANGPQTARFTLSGEGVALRASIATHEPSGPASWTIDEGRVQLSSWVGALAHRYLPAAATVTATGDLVVTGSGTLDGFQPTGQITLLCENSTVRDETAGWTLEGVSFRGDFSLGSDFALSSATAFDFGIRTITTSRLGARAFSLRGRLKNMSSVDVENARIEIAGGEVTSGRFLIPMAPLSIDTRVQIKRIGLQDFAQLFPSGLADARGRLDGELSLGWSPADGFKIGIGRITLDEFEPTVIRLAASPGFLTSRIPARFEFLPGALGRWLSIRNDVFDDLQDIELGRTDLVIKSLQLFLTPDGDSEGRSARVVFDASPSDQTGAVKQVVFTVNVSGPLSQLLNIGMTDNLSFETR